MIGRARLAVRGLARRRLWATAAGGICTLLLAGLGTQPAAAAPFACTTSTVFIAQDTPTRLYEQAYGTGSTSFVPLGPVSGTNYNALGFNPIDNFLYAIDNANNGDLLRIHDDGTVESLGAIAGGLPSALVGAFDDNGDFYVSPQNGPDFRIVDVTAGPPTAVTRALSEPHGLPDWTFVGGSLWGATATAFVRVDPATGTVTRFPQSLTGAGPFGAAWTYGNGDLGILSNSTGNVYRVQIADPGSASPSFSLVSTATGPTSANNDGAACPGLPTDLSVEKAGPAVVEPGERVTWTITVTNRGPGDSAGMTLSDDLPGGIQEPRTSTPGCTVVGGQVQCVLGLLAAGASTTVEIDGRMPATPSTCVTNTVTALPNGVDPDPADNRATATTCTPDPPPPPSADLRITKTASPADILLGNEVVYTLTVTNDGPDAAADVQVTDSPAAGVTPRSATPSQGSCPSATSCALGTLAPGQSATVEIRATASALGALGNTARVSSPTPDPDPSNNTSTTTVRVDPQADLRIVKEASAEQVVEGDDLTYRLRVTNAGPSTARDVVVTDALPPGMRLRSAAAGAGECSQQAPVVCRLGDVAAGDEVAITLEVTAAAEGLSGNTVTVDSPTPDPDPSNNTSTTTVEVTPQADVRIVKQASASRITEGDDFAYRLRVSNAGPSTARDVVVTDALPPGVRLRSVTSSTGSCTQADPVVCRLGDLAAGGEVTITLAVTATRSGAAANTATVVSGTPDPDPSNNQSTTTVDSAPSADLGIAKHASETAPLVGESFTYRLEVANRGPSTATGVVVADRIPDGLRVDAVHSSQGSCTGVRTVVCELGSLRNGATATVRIVVTALREGPMSNGASVTSETPDPDPRDNITRTPTSPSTRADLAIAKTASVTAVAPGGSVVYGIVVTNHGPSGAKDVTVTDPLPAGARVVSVTPSAGACEVAEPTRALVCRIGDLASGASATIRLEMAFEQAGTTRNVAVVTSPTPDPDPTNNQSETEVTSERADVSITKAASAAAVRVGQAVGYTLTVQNAGPDPARGVVVTDPIPAGLRVRDVSTSGGSCAIVARTAVCRIGDVAPGATVAVTVAGEAVRHGLVGNTATVVTREPTDPHVAGNADSAWVRVRPGPARLAVSKRASQRRASTGDRVRYRIVVRNTGSRVARGVVVCDRLGAGLAFASRPGSALRSGQACWRVGTLGPGERKAIRLTARVLAGSGAVLRNTAVARAANTAATRSVALVRRPAAPGRAGGVTG